MCFYALKTAIFLQHCKNTKLITEGIPSTAISLVNNILHAIVVTKDRHMTQTIHWPGVMGARSPSRRGTKSKTCADVNRAHKGSELFQSGAHLVSQHHARAAGRLFMNGALAWDQRLRVADCDLLSVHWFGCEGRAYRRRGIKIYWAWMTVRGGGDDEGRTPPPSTHTLCDGQCMQKQPATLSPWWLGSCCQQRQLELCASTPCITRTIMGESSKTIRAHVCAAGAAHSAPESWIPESY